MKQIVFITGGVLSGKSSCAERLALSLSPSPVYLTTSYIWDERFRQWVLRHQANRGPKQTNIEEEKGLSHHFLQGRVVLIDCVTLWCTNYFFNLEADTDKVLATIETGSDRSIEREAIFIFITNEIGIGDTSENLIQRKFANTQGWVNQYIVTQTNQVLLMVSGIPVKVKDEKQTIG